MPRGKKKSPAATPGGGSIQKGVNEQRKVLQETKDQFNPPILEVNIQTGEVKWHRRLFRDFS